MNVKREVNCLNKKGYTYNEQNNLCLKNCKPGYEFGYTKRTKKFRCVKTPLTATQIIAKKISAEKKKCNKTKNNK